MQKTGVFEKPSLYQKRYLVSVIKVVVCLLTAAYILTCEQFARVKLKPYRFEIIRTYRHLHIYQFAAAGFTVYIKTYLSVADVFN
jgi:hypothetical protein